LWDFRRVVSIFCLVWYGRAYEGKRQHEAYLHSRKSPLSCACLPVCMFRYLRVRLTKGFCQ
ncbi:hypothetical protein CI238_08650, partial [Colletotrichum incanum]